MAYTKFITLKDTNSSPLWSGEEVVVMVTSPIKFSGTNILSPNTKSFQVTTLTTEDSGSYANNYNRRKANVSYSGFQPVGITVECIYDNSYVGNTPTLGGSTTKIFTPSKLFELILNPRTLYLNDHRIVPLLITAQDGSPAIYSSSGIPVVLDTWSMIPDPETNEILISLAFIEDKEIS